MLIPAVAAAVAACVAAATARPAHAGLPRTTTSLQVSASSVETNADVTLTATITSSTGSALPAGAVTFSTSGGTTLASQNVPANTASPFTVAVHTSFATAETYDLVAAYKPSASWQVYLDSSSVPVQLTVTAGAPTTQATTITLSASPTTVQKGDTVTLTGTVTTPGGTAVPTGDVEFDDDGVSLGQVTVDSKGIATKTVPDFSAGAHTITAKYLGHSSYQPSPTSSSVTVTVAAPPTQSATTVALTANPATVQAGGTETLTATVTGGGSVPTGDVAFADNGIPLGKDVALDGSGVATLTSTGFTAGSHTITAKYLGDSTHETSSGTAGISVTAPPTKSATTVALTANPATVQAGGTETLTAAVTGGGSVPTGDVAFADNGIPLGNVVALDGSGVATLSWTGFTAGSHTITATYEGDSTHETSSSTAGISVTAPPTAVATSITASVAPNPIVAGGSATLTAHVEQALTKLAPPQGEIVTFRNKADGSLIAQAALDASGDASVVKTGWLAGQYEIVATYVGDSADQPASTSFPADVRAVAKLTVTAPSPSLTYGASLPALTPTYSGFTNGDDASSLTSQATCTTTASDPPAAGSYPVTCSGAASPYYTFTYVPGTLTVAKATLSVTPNDVTIHQGDPIPSLAATISGFVNGETLATSGVTGSASCTTTATSSSPPGAYPITCTLGTLAAADYDFTVTGQGTLTVLPTGAIPTVTIAWIGGAHPVGQPVQLLGSLFAGWYPLPGRTLTLSLGSTSCHAVTNWIGMATCTVVATGPLGPTTSTATFSGSDRYLASSDSRAALLYAFPAGGGAFAIGDESAAHSHSVTFWGSQWSRENELSHGDAPRSFKGFAAEPATPTIGADWSTGPGNSPRPPAAPLPSYMGVIVTSSAERSRSSISGRVDDIAIVETDPGYAPDPGHAGSGTVVATVSGLDVPELPRHLRMATEQSTGPEWTPPPQGRPWPGHARAE